MLRTTRTTRAARAALRGVPGPVPEPATTATLALLAASALWGTTGTAQALADLDASPSAVGAARLAAGALALVAVCGLGGRWRALPRMSRSWWAGVAVAAVSAGLYQVTFFSAVHRSGVAVGTLVVLGSAPIFCGVLDRAVNRARLSPWWAVATASAVTGCAVLVLPGRSATVNPGGVALALVAGLCYGGYTVSVKRLLSDGAPPLLTLTGTLAGGALLLTPVLLGDLAPLVSPRGAALVAWLGLAATAGAYLLFVRGLGRTSAATAGTLSLAEPVVGAGLGILLLGEPLSRTVATGIALLLAGLVLAAAAGSGRGPAAGRQPMRSASETTIPSGPRT